MSLARALAIAALFCFGQVAHSAVTYEFEQTDSSTVTLRASGSLDISGFSQVGSNAFLPPLFNYQSNTFYFLLVGSGNHDRYRRTGPLITQESFTTGPFTATASNTSGDFVGILQNDANPSGPQFAVLVPPGYVSGTDINAASQQFTGSTLSDLRLRAGTFTWTYGSAGADSFVFEIPGNSVGGSVSGLSGSVTLQLNGQDDLVVATNGVFIFPQELVFGDSYSVSVLQQPVGQTCSPTNGTGTMAGADVSTVWINCINNDYPVGGAVLGLLPGEFVVLQNNGTDNLTIGNNGNYQFATPLEFGTPYNVTVLTQPASEVCTVLNPTGNVSTNTNNVIVNCLPETYTVSGDVSGLDAGESVTLQNNGADNQNVPGNTSFTFSAQADGSAYSVTVASEPAGKVCSVTGGTGTISGANITGVSVECTALTYPIGGAVYGLVPGDSLVLQNNGGDDLILSGDGGFAFSTALPTGAPYNVSVLTQPPAPSETCIVANGSGTTPVGGVSDVIVTCTVDTFPVSGEVVGLASGNSISLRLNGADEQTLTGNGVFTFSPIADGTGYSVTVSVQPSGQACSVTNGTGTVAGASITNVLVTCVDEQFTIGGLLSGLVTGDSVVLQNNGGDNLTLTADGAFTFATPVDFGDPYAVTVLTQPTAPSETCTVNNGSGITPAANVNNVAVVCALNSFAVGGAVSGLAAGETVVLQNNGADDRQVSVDGNFVFSRQADGTDYAVTVASQPSGKTCTVTGGSGTLSGSDVTSVAVVCENNLTPPAQAAPVPALSIWMMSLLAAVIAGLGASSIGQRL